MTKKDLEIILCALGCATDTICAVTGWPMKDYDDEDIHEINAQLITMWHKVHEKVAKESERLMEDTNHE